MQINTNRDNFFRNLSPNDSTHKINLHQSFYNNGKIDAKKIYNFIMERLKDHFKTNNNNNVTNFENAFIQNKELQYMFINATYQIVTKCAESDEIQQKTRYKVFEHCLNSLVSSAAKETNFTTLKTSFTDIYSNSKVDYQEEIQTYGQIKTDTLKQNLSLDNTKNNEKTSLNSEDFNQLSKQFDEEQKKFKQLNDLEKQQYEKDYKINRDYIDEHLKKINEIFEKKGQAYNVESTTSDHMFESTFQNNINSNKAVSKIQAIVRAIQTRKKLKNQTIVQKKSLKATTPKQNESIETDLLTSRPFKKSKKNNSRFRKLKTVINFKPKKAISNNIQEAFDAWRNINKNRETKKQKQVISTKTFKPLKRNNDKEINKEVKTLIEKLNGTITSLDDFHALLLEANAFYNAKSSVLSKENKENFELHLNKSNLLLTDLEKINDFLMNSKIASKEQLLAISTFFDPSYNNILIKETEAYKTALNLYHSLSIPSSDFRQDNLDEMNKLKLTKESISTHLSQMQSKHLKSFKNYQKTKETFEKQITDKNNKLSSQRKEKLKNKGRNKNNNHSKHSVNKRVYWGEYAVFLNFQLDELKKLLKNDNLKNEIDNLKFSSATPLEKNEFNDKKTNIIKLEKKLKRNLSKGNYEQLEKLYIKINEKFSDIESNIFK